MALLKFKRSAVSGKVPTLADLELGELAINTFDGKLYLRKDNGTASIVEVGGGSGVLSFNSRTGAITLTSGDVTGALGYTPANKAGDTFSGAITVNSGSHQVNIASDGNIEITRSGGGAYIDFKDSTAEDFDARIQQSGSGFGITGTVSAGSDFRAPIFYDSNDTGYYADPNGASSFYELSTYFVRNKQTGNRAMYLDGSTWNQFADPNGATKLWLGGTLDPSNYYNANTHYFRDAVGNNYAYINSGQAVILGGRPITISSSTGSVQIKGDGGGWSTGTLFYGSAGTYKGGFGALGGTDTLDYYWIGSDYNTATLYIYASGYAQASGSLRAPIFYDSNNTGYYTDPAGTSNLYGLTVAATINGFVSGCTFSQDSQDRDNITTRVDSGFYQSSTGTTAEGWPLNDGGWQHMLSCTHTNDGNYFAMQLGAGFFSQGLFYRSVNNNGSQAWSRVALYGNNYAGNLYASVYYDSDNTGYYIDAASASNIFTVNAVEYRRGANVIRGAANANWLSLYFDAAGADKFHFASDGNLWVGLWGAWVSDQWRSSIYYDYNDTGYYCDPNGTSYLNTVSLGAQTWRGDITWNTGVNVIVPASAECSFDINSSGVWQVWDLTTSAPMIKCPAGSNVEIGQAGARGLYVYGSIYATGNVTAYSDASVKNNIKPITGALDKVASIGGYTFTRIDLPDTERVYGGVIAQEIETVLPEAVFEKDDKKSVDYNATIALLIEAIKELNNKVEDLEAKLRSE